MNILELDQLQSPLAEVQSHAIIKPHVRRNHAKAAKRLAHLARLGDQLFVPLRIVIALDAGRGARSADHTSRRRKHEIAGGVIVVGFGVDEKPDGQRRQLLHRLHL